MSLVDVQPSDDMALKLSATPARRTSVSSAGLDRGVGREHGEHRRHVRGEHRRALGHAADGEARRRATTRLLAVRVGGADGLGRRHAAGVVSGAAGHEPGDAAGDRVHRQRVADQPGGADEHLVGRAARAAPATAAHIASASARPAAPVAALAQPLLRTTAAARPPVSGEVGVGGDDRRGRHLVLGEHGRGRDRPAVGGGDQAQVEVARRLDAARDAAGG